MLSNIPRPSPQSPQSLSEPNVVIYLPRPALLVQSKTTSPLMYYNTLPLGQVRTHMSTGDVISKPISSCGPTFYDSAILTFIHLSSTAPFGLFGFHKNSTITKSSRHQPNSMLSGTIPIPVNCCHSLHPPPPVPPRTRTTRTSEHRASSKCFYCLPHFTRLAAISGS